MTEPEIKAVADEIEARAKAKLADKYAKVKSFVLHNGTACAIGAAVLFGVMKFIL